MPRYRVTIVQIYDITGADGEPLSLDDVHDSLMDNMLDAQDSQLLTSDDKLDFSPKEILSFSVEEVNGE